MKKLILFLVAAILCAETTTALAFQEEDNAVLDRQLAQRIEYFRLKPFSGLGLALTDQLKAQAKLGQLFYMDPRMSGNQNMNCMICHHVMLGTSDRRPLSQTEDRMGVLKRNSPSLFNIGFRPHFMFWDGRVAYNPTTKVFTTPEPALNGENPTASHITKVLTSAASAQAIFPLITDNEMMGKPGQNEIANAPTNLEKWDLIVKRFLDPKDKDYNEIVFYFQKAYPGIKVEEINIGHFGEAMNTFMKLQFESKGSPFHRYLNGEKEALTAPQKRGLMLFTGKGLCINCHAGNLLENGRFFTSVGIPSYGEAPHTPDRGRGEVEGERKNFMFRTPSLINVGLSAPYMHNGIFKTLRDVVNHYSDISVTVREFQVTPQMKVDYPVVIEANRGPAEIEALWSAVKASFLKPGIHFSEEEKDDLVDFLQNGLTDPRFTPPRR